MKKKATKRAPRQAPKKRKRKTKAELERENKALRRKLAKATKPKAKAKGKAKTKSKARKVKAKTKPKVKRRPKPKPLPQGRPVEDPRRPRFVKLTTRGVHLRELYEIGQALLRVARALGFDGGLHWFVYKDGTRAVDLNLTGVRAETKLVEQLDALLIDWSEYEKDLSHPRDRAAITFYWDRSGSDVPGYLKDALTTSLHYRIGGNFGELLISARVHIEQADKQGWRPSVERSGFLRLSLRRVLTTARKTRKRLPPELRKP